MPSVSVFLYWFLFVAFKHLRTCKLIHSSMKACHAVTICYVVVFTASYEQVWFVFSLLYSSDVVIALRP